MATAAMLDVPRDYDPEEDDFEDLPPAKPKASRSRKRRRSSAAATAAAPSVAATVRPAEAPTTGATSAFARPQSSITSVQRGGQSSVLQPRLGRHQGDTSARRDGRRLVRQPTPESHQDDTAVRRGSRLLVDQARRLRHRGDARGRVTRGVRPQPRPQARPIQFADMIASDCSELPADPSARAREIIRQLGERREQDHQAFMATLDRELEAYKRARNCRCSVDKQR